MDVFVGSRGGLEIGRCPEHVNEGVKLPVLPHGASWRRRVKGYNGGGCIIFTSSTLAGIEKAL